MKLGGWTRLFIVVSALWTLVVVVGALVLRDSLFAAEKAPAKANVVGLERGERMTLEEFEAGLLEPDKPPTNSLGKQIVERMQRADRIVGLLERGGVAAPVARDATTAKRLNQTLVATLVAVWILPVIALFGIGHAVGWVIRGFKQSVAPPTGSA